MTSAGESQRYSQVRMIIQRAHPDLILVTVSHRTVRGQSVWDRRLGYAQFSVSSVDGDPDDLLTALQAALDALRSHREQRGP